MGGQTIAIADENEFYTHVNSNALTVVDFTASWCGPCKAVAPRYEALAAAPENSNSKFLKVDVDEFKSLAKKYEITAMPTFAFFRAGEVVEKVVGADIAKVESFTASLGADTSSLNADELKALGNKAFTSGSHALAVFYFSEAITKDPSNHVLFSNRSAAYASLRNYTKALLDAEKTVELNASWPKGYSRKGAALHGMAEFEEAAAAYRKALELEPGNAATKKALEEAENLAEEAKRMAAEPKDDVNDMEAGLGKLFGGDVFSKIAQNPKLSPLLAQPDYVSKIAEIQKNPSSINMYMQDPRIMNTMLGLMGLDAQAMGRDEMDAKMKEEEEEVKPAASSSSSKPAPAKAPEPMEVDEEESEEKKARAASDKAKEAGNALYKKRNFAEAIAKYDEAWELDETNVAVLTNKSAVLFEMGDYEECIKVCDAAVEKARELRADYKIVAKALGRMGSAYSKQNDLKNAIKYYEKSLSEHRTPDILTKLREVEKQLKAAEKEAYRNPQLSDAAREIGNELFKKHEYAEAVKHYTEAIKRNDADPRNFSNRAACYIKLMALPEADRDCDEALKIDPGFVKAYIRKASILVAKRDFTKAMDMCQEAKEKDVEGKHTAEIDGVMVKAYAGLNEVQSGGGNREEILARAMQDPEVQNIMSDPIMKTILQQMQEDPAAARDHMKNPAIAAKIRTLINAGIIQTR